MIAGTVGYAEAAEVLARQYEGLAFVDVHKDVLHLFPTPASRILDVGAGSGRDAAALARAGHHVVAVEPTDELRAVGERLHASERIEWLADALPDLSALPATCDFDMILLSAVWMHLDKHERHTAMGRLATLTAPSARIILTLRHGPVPPGRRMFDVSAEETIANAAAAGLRLVHRSSRQDALGRPDLTWTILAFKPTTHP
ncbi:class I SAM-dependent methyltransferase [Actinomadura sp. KC216]|uniref:class I SAM-dependent methyltransferase n=1 Tax=Actinomadura sp. KC216 TaxID=2530370 RepID=UPI00104DDF79|nr:class I SAM-dependent methyltransferase [Actinomadura sp. KC216]TDB71748.1 class I SAM-dependent methyltransferase [Actinomadura sp. KC216]